MNIIKRSFSKNQVSTNVAKFQVMKKDEKQLKSQKLTSEKYGKSEK